MKKVSMLFLIAIMVGVFITSCSKKTEMVAESQVGEALVKQLWDDLSTADTAAIRLFMANGFQSVHGNGAINSEQEIQLISGLSIDGYSIIDLNCTQNGNVIIATYMVSVEETIEGNRLSKLPAARMSVFVKNDGKWQFLAHANLKSLNAQQ